MADEQIVTSIVAKADLSSLVSEVHRASASLQQLQRELLASNKAISSSTKLANNLFRDTLTGSGQFSSHFVNLNSDVDKFGKNLDAGRLKLKNYFSTFREHATTQKGMIRELAKEQVMLQNSVLQPLGRNAQGLMQYNVMIPRGLDMVKNGTSLARMELQIMNRALSEGAGSLINWGKNTQWAGRQLTVGLTVPLTMFGAASGKAFREADQELVRLTKVYGGLAATSASDLKAIRDEVVQTAKTLSQTMGASFKDTIALGADIAATGKMGNELLGSIEETTRLSILGEVDRQDAMKATLSIQTAFKQNTQQLTESINFLNAVENQTSTTLNDLVEAIPKAGPVIQQLGGSIEDLALYMTAMREGGINASEGANALKSGLASLINPTKQTVGMMSDFGIDVMGMVAKNTGNTTGLLTDLQGALDKLDPLSKARALEQMFGKFQFARMSALLNNLGKEGSQTLQVMDLMKASTSDLAGIAERELGMITESASGKYRKAIETLKATLAEVGEEFLGVATKIINAASKILDFFTSLPSPIKKALTFLAGFTALVGPLIMLTGVLANFFGYITKGIVQLRAFFMRASGWKMLTPEIIAAQKAAEMVENAFYSDAAAAQVLHNALQKLVLDYQNLSAASMKNAVPVNAGVSTVAGNTVMAAGRRVVDPNDPYVGDLNTRAMSHVNPRDPNNPATIFGGVPGAVPVNRGIARTPQVYMQDRLPNVEGLTSVKGISTGIVPGEAAKFHALMATLGMQTEQEVAALKKTIAMGGTVSRELLDTFDDILPITQKFANSAATQSALIVQQMRNAEITVEQAKARILALNAQIEADMGAAVSLYAAGRGRTLDLTKAPMMNQPVVDANGQFTLRDLYKKKANLSVMEEFGRLRGVRSFGAPYSIQTTRPPRFNDGGEIESFGPGKTMVSGPSSINYDDRLGSVPIGGYVLNQSASMDPSNAPLVAMASATYEDGGKITAALTPQETVFGPKIQRMPELYAAVDAANSGYNFGGQIMSGVTGYGKQTDKTPNGINKAEFKKQMKEYLRFINNPRYEDDVRLRMIMLDASELVQYAGMSPERAIRAASSNFDLAKSSSGGSLEKFVEQRIKQVKGLERRYPALKHPNSEATRTTSSTALNKNLNNVRDAMLRSPQFKDVWDLVERVTPTKINPGGVPLLDQNVRGHLLRHGEVGYATRGHMGVAAVLPHSINSVMATLQKIGISPDILNLDALSARKSLETALRNVGLSKVATPDDIFAALQDDGLFKSKAQIQSGNVVRSTKMQRGSLSMLLEAAAERKKWIFRGRPPIPVLLNKGGMIPGGSISRKRTSYGNPISLLAPEKMLKILTKAKELSSRGSLGSFADTPITKYGHLVSPSSGMSYPIPGVSGVYRDPNGKLIFVKGVNHEVVAKHEPVGASIVRRGFGIHTPVMSPRTVPNHLDPTKKTKLLALESDYDPRFGQTNIPWKEDTVIRQLAASLLMNNKDLSRSNVFGNFNPDVGQSGVFKAASGNTALARPNELNSMEKQAMINLLAVRGGARKDFARDTAPIVAKMSPRKYGRLMKKTLEEARPEIVKIIDELPKDMREPYIALLKRLDDGIDVDWSKYHAIHANPKYLNAGGPVGGGPVKRGRSAYGAKKGAQRPGNPVARAAWDSEQRAQRERDASAARSRAASHQVYGQQALTSGLGREAVRTGTTSFYNPGQVMINNMLDPFKNSAMMKAKYLQASFNIASDSVMKGSIRLNLEVLNAANKIGNAYKKASVILTSYAASAQSAILSGINSVQNFGSRFKNAIIEQQNRYAATRYPANQAPAQGFFGPGFVGGYKDTGVEGVQSRKVGTIGIRKTEYLVNGNSMSAAQAKASGINIPGRSGVMPMGAMMGIGMAGSMGGMALMQQEKVGGMTGMQAGMGLMAASTILPMLPFGKMAGGIKSAGSALKGLTTGLDKMARFGAMLGRFAKGFGLIGLAIGAAGLAFKLYKDYKDAQQDATMGLSMTAKAAEQAGVKYFNLKETMQGYIDKTKLAAAAAKGSAGNAIGMPGLPKSIEDLKKAKEEGKGLKDLIESLNRSESKGETQRLINNQKAQMIAAGMSIEEANRKIYGALANSNKSKQAYQLIADQGFGAIVDKSTAAEFAVGNLVNTLKGGAGTADWYKEIGNGFEGLINVFQNATSSLVGTKDALGNVIDDYKAYEMVMSQAEASNPGINEEIGRNAYENLQKTQPLLASITNSSDTIKGILAKWKLFTSGINIDLSKIDSTLAIKLAGFNSAIDSGVTALTKAADDKTTFGTIGKAYEALQKTISATSAAAQRANAASQRSAQEELKVIAQKIKLIDEEKNKKLESLRATQDASNYALELQKLQIEYADALSRGDMATAARARLDIDQLTLNRQSDLAVKAIEDAAEKAKKPLEKDAEAISNAQDKKNVTFQNNQDNSAVAAEISDKLVKFQGTFNDLTSRSVAAQILSPKKRAEEEAKIQAEFVAFVKEVQDAYVKGGKTLKETLEKAFPDYFNKGKPVSPETLTKGSPTGFDAKGNPIFSETKTPFKGILDSFKDDVAALTAFAEKITGKVTIKELRDDVVRALGGYNSKPPKGTVEFGKDTVQRGVGKSAIDAAKNARSSGSSAMVSINDVVWYRFSWNGEDYISNDSGTEVYSWDDKKKTKGKRVKKASGGIVKHFGPGGGVSGPGTATSDSIPAMLSDGEFVLSAKAVDAAGGPEAVDAWHKALRKADGGPIASWMKPRSPYNSKNQPTGSPYSRYWGELERLYQQSPMGLDKNGKPIFNNDGKDPWGGTEIPGLAFNGKIANFSDYFHQLAEQPRKSSGSGMGIDKDPMRYAGSGASMGGIGSGAYGAVNFLFMAEGGKVKQNWFQRYVASSTKSSNETQRVLDKSPLTSWMSADPLGANSVLRLIAGQKRKGDVLNAALAPLSFAGLGVGRKAISKASALPINAFAKATERQGVQVVDKRFGKFISDLMEMGYVPASKAKTRIDQLLTEYQIAAKYPFTRSSEILESTGSGAKSKFDQNVNIYSPAQLQYTRAKGDVFPFHNTLYARNFDKIKDNIGGTLAGLKAFFGKGKGVPYHLRGAVHVTPETSPQIVMHELGHRNLELMGGPEKLYSAGKYKPYMSGGAHEGHADSFAYLAGETGQMTGLPTLKKVTNPFKGGRFYNHPASDLGENIVNHLRVTRVADAPRPDQGDSTWLQAYAEQVGKLFKGNISVEGAGKAIEDAKFIATFTEKMFNSREMISIWQETLLDLSSGLKNRSALSGLADTPEDFMKLVKDLSPEELIDLIKKVSKIGGFANGGLAKSLSNLGLPMFENGINMVPANMLAVLHKDEAVIPANMNPYNPNASAAVSGSLYNINVELNGTNLTADQVAASIHKEMRLREMAAGINRRVGG